MSVIAANEDDNNVVISINYSPHVVTLIFNGDPTDRME